MLLWDLNGGTAKIKEGTLDDKFSADGPQNDGSPLEVLTEAQMEAERSGLDGCRGIMFGLLVTAIGAVAGGILLIH